MRDLINDKKLVVKHNKLIEFKGKMTPNELKLFSLIIANVREQQKNIFERYSIDISPLKDNTNHNDFYNYMKDVASRLITKTISVEKINDNGKRESCVINLVYRPKIVEDSKYLEIYIDKELVPYILDLKKEFTRYQIENILKLKSGHAIRIYELMKQYQPIGQRELKIDEIKDYLGIEKDEYKRFYDFEKWVLKTSKDEINGSTDILIDYEKNKKGKKIESITFKISHKFEEDQKYKELLESTYDIKNLKARMGLENENLNSEQIINLYSIAVNKTQDEVDVFEYVKLNYNYMIAKGTARNKYSYLMKLLEEDHAKAFAQLNMGYIVKEKSCEDISD